MDNRPDLKHLENISVLLDDLIRIPVINKRVGLDPIIGLVPWAGDAISIALSFYLIGNAVYYRVPKTIIARMAINTAFDYTVGIIPVIGDAYDFIFKSNRRNMNLLRKHAGQRQKPRFSDYLFVWGIIGSLIVVIAAIIFLLYGLINAGANYVWQKI